MPGERKNVLVPVNGNKLDGELVRLGCSMVRHSKGTLYLMNVVELPRSLPIDAEVDTTRSNQLLHKAAGVAEEMRQHCEVEVVQAREVGSSIVEEADAHACGLIILGVSPHLSRTAGVGSLGRTMPYVLEHSHCRVWVVRDPQ